MLSRRWIPLFWLFSCSFFLVSCGSGGKNSGETLNANVVVNPNTANGKADNNQLPTIQFESLEHDFGKIIEGETVSFPFVFTNSGKSDLVIAEVSTSCGCTVPSYPKTAIAPGKKATISVSFNSRGRRGFQTKSIIVLANTQPNVTQLKIKAQVVAPGSD